MAYCATIPSVGESNLPSRVFSSVLNFKDTITPEDIANMGIKAKSIRDLATLLFKYSQSSNIVNKGLPVYDDTGEVKLANVLASILNRTDLNENVRNVYQKMMDILNEPVSSKYDPVIKYGESFTQSDINYSNAVLTQLYLELRKELPSIASKSQISLKKAILNKLIKKIKEHAITSDERNTFVNKDIIELLKVDSILWNNFLSYLNRTQDIDYRNIKQDLTIEDIQGTFQTTDGLEEVWDAVEQDKKDRQNNIAIVVKSKLAEILNDVHHSENKSDRWFIPRPLNLNSLWNKLINLHMNNLTADDVYNSLVTAVKQFDETENTSEYTNIVGFKRIIELFDKAKEGDLESQNFVNGYVSGVKLAVIPSNHIALDKGFVAKIRSNNRGSFAVNIYNDRFLSVIDTNIKFGLYKDVNFKTAKVEVHRDGNGNIIIEDTINALIDTFNKLGLSITKRALNSYINSQRDIEKTFSDLTYITNKVVEEIAYLKNNPNTIVEYSNKTSANKGNLYKLSEIAAFDFDSITNLSYLDVNGELNYSPQYENLLTSLFRGIVLNGEIRENYLNYRFADYLNSPAFENDHLLWYDPVTDIGLFERTRKTDGSGYVLNKKFADRIAKGEIFEISQFDGIMVNGKGYKYNTIQSTAYKFTEIIANLLNQYVFLTSDSPRSYMISVPHINTDDLYVKTKEDKSSKVGPKVDKSLSWNELSSLPIYNSKGVMVMRKTNTHAHFGNPFTATQTSTTLIQVNSIEEAVRNYVDWLNGSDALIPQNKIDNLSDQRDWILSQIDEGKLDNATLLYMNKKVDGSFYYSHADALADFVKERRGISTSPSVNSYTGDIKPENNTVFVFGSNTEGRHGAGSAKVAVDKFGAKYGQASGLQGSAYGLVTKDLSKGERSISKEDIINNIKELYKTARENPQLNFKVAYRNTLNSKTLNGYTAEEMINMFISADTIPSNVYFSKEWVDTNLFNKEESSTSPINTGSKIFYAISKIVLNDINIFQNYGSRIFGIDMSTEQGRAEIKTRHNIKYWDGKSIFDKNGIPTGRAFKFLNVTYVENGVQKNIVDFMSDILGIDASIIYKSNIDSILNDTLPEYDIRDYISSFVTRYIQYAEQAVKDNFTDIKGIVEQAMSDSGNSSIFSQKIKDTIDAEVSKIVNEFESSVNRKATNQEVARMRSKVKTDIEHILDKTTYDRIILSAFLNNTILATSFDNIVNGTLSEYSNSTQYNKRGAQIIKTGIRPNDTGGDVKILAVDDMSFVSNILDSMPESIKEWYAKPSKINDSMSIMTDVTLENILRSVGRWQEYEAIVTDLRDTSKPFNPILYKKLVEQLKLFSVARKRRGDFFRKSSSIENDIFANDVDTVQIKDSTIVLFESTTRGSALGDIYDWMINPDNQINQISPKSSIKVSGITTVPIHNDQGQFVAPVLDDTNILYMKPSDFVIQQDVKADILDVEITLGTQFQTQIMQGLGASEYSIGDKKYTPKELIQSFQKTISSNIQEDAIEVIYELGAVAEDGTVRTDENGNILVNTRKLTKYLKNLVQNDDSSQNIREALEINVEGMPVMPLSYPVTYKKFEKIIASKFTKNVITQKISGFHAPIRADIFTGSNQVITRKGITRFDDYQKAVNELQNNGSITYSDSFIQSRLEEAKREGTVPSFELRAERRGENGEFLYAEVITNPWLQEFFNTIPLTKQVTMSDGSIKEIYSIDINEIPVEGRRMLGIRIPTEGKMSMVIFEVVGILNTGATQAIFPQSLVIRTGWDFDIDSIFAYYKQMNFDGNAYTLPKFDERSVAESGQELTSLYMLRNTLKSALREIKTATDNGIDNLNSRMFDKIVKYHTLLYNTKSPNQNNIHNIVQNINTLLENVPEDKRDTKEFKDLLKIKSLIKDSLSYLSNNIYNNFNKAGDSRTQIQQAIAYLKAIKNGEVTQQERLSLQSTDSFYLETQKLLYEDTLLAIEKDLIKSQRVLKRINSLINKIAIGTEEVSSFIDESTFLDVRSQLVDYTNGLIKDEQGNTFQIFKELDAIEDSIKQAYNKVAKSQDVSIEEIEESTYINRQARDNHIINVAESVLSNPYHEFDVNKPNTTDNIKSVADYVNQLWSSSLNSLNPHNLSDKIKFNTISMSSTVLKGHSVNFDMFAAIASTLKARLPIGIKRNIALSTLPKNLTSKEYNNYFGVGNWKVDKDKGIVTVEDKYISNNASGTFTDISGLPITYQLSEVTAAILDILQSELASNLNIHTLSLFRALSSGVATELYEGKPNRFAFATAFISQPIIVDIIEDFSLRSISDPYYSIEKAINNIEKRYKSKLIAKSNKIDIKSAIYKHDYFTTEELFNNIKNKDNNDIENLLSQLKVLKNYREYKKISDDITNLTFILKTQNDVKDFSTVDKREAKLADYYIDSAQFKSLIKNTLDNSKTWLKGIIDNSIPSKAAELKADFNNLDVWSFKDKYKDLGIPKNFITQSSYYTEINEFVNLITYNDRKNRLELLDIEYAQSTKLLVENQDVVEAIFTGNEKGFISDGKFNAYSDDSIYPIIQARYQFGHWLAGNMFNDVFAQRSLSIRKAVNSFLSTNNKVYDDVSRNYIINSILEYHTQLPKDEVLPVMYGVPDNVIQTILGIVPEQSRELHNKYMSDLLGHLGEDITDEKFIKWTTLTLGEQIALIKSDKALSAYINKVDFKGSNIFNYVQSYPNSIVRRGYELLKVVKDDNNIISTDDVAAGIEIMMESPIPYIAHTIRNLIAYTYITEGFVYGMNISKYISPKLMNTPIYNSNYEHWSVRNGVIDPAAGISDYAKNLRLAESSLIHGENHNIGNALDYISRQNPSVNMYMPQFKEQDITNKDNPTIATLGLLTDPDSTNPTENLAVIPVIDANGEIRQIILETVDRVKNSRFANARYLTQNTGTSTVVWKRSDPISYSSSDIAMAYYYYYPVGKLLRNEFSEESVIDSWNISNEIRTVDGGTRSVDKIVEEHPLIDTFLLTVDKRIKAYQENTDILADNASQNYSIEDSSTINKEEIKIEDEEVPENTGSFSAVDQLLFRRSDIVFADVDVIEEDTTLLKTIEKASKDVSNFIYIGNTENDLSSIYKSNKEFINVNFTKNPYKEAERITQQLKEGKYLIVGDTLKDAGISNKTMINWTKHFITRLYELNGNIDAINTVLNEGFGTAVSQVYADTERGNYTYKSPQFLFKTIVNVNQPSDVGVEARTLENSKIANRAFSSLNSLRSFVERHNVPNRTAILEGYRQFSAQEYPGALKSELDKAQYAAVEYTFSRMIPIVSSIMTSINTLLNDLEKVNLNTIHNDYAKQKEYEVKLDIARQLAVSLTKYTDVQKIGINDTNYDPNDPEQVAKYHEEFDGVNSIIEELMNYGKNAIASKNSIRKLSENVLVWYVIKDSRNPKYVTAFSKILEEARKDTFDPNNIDITKLEISDSEFRDIVAKVMNIKTMSINLAQRYLDSAFVTGVTLSDIVGKQFTHITYENTRKAHAVQTRLKEIFDKVDPKLYDNDNALSNYFKKFVNENGDFIDSYDYALAYEQVEELISQINNIYQKDYYGAKYLSREIVKEILSHTNNLINDFGYKSIVKLEKLSEAEAADLSDKIVAMPAEEQAAYIRKNHYVNITHIVEVGGKPESISYKMVFNPSKKNKDFDALNDTDKQFLTDIKDLIQDVITEYNPNWLNSYIYNRNIIPYLTKTSTAFNIRNFIGMPVIEHDDKYIGIDDIERFRTVSKTLTTPRFYPTYHMLNRWPNESWEDYEERVVENFNKWYNSLTEKVSLADAKLEDANTIAKISTYNKKVVATNKNLKVERMSFNIKDVIMAFSKELYNLKSLNDFQVIFDLGKFVAYEIVENAPSKPKNVENWLAQWNNMENRAYDASKVTRGVDVAAKALMRYASVNYMWFNLSAGLKNVAKGFSDMIIDATPMGFVDAKNMTKGIWDICKLVPSLIAEIGKEGTNNKYIALIKDFEVIFQDTKDTTINISTETAFTRMLSMADRVGYAPNQIGEYVMQFGMLLAAARSHRVINGRIMSFSDFYDESRSKILTDLLTEDQKRDFNNWKEKRKEQIEKYEKRNNKEYKWIGDYAGEYLRSNMDKFSKEQKKAFIKHMKDNKNEFKIKFEKFATFESVISVENGRLSYDKSTGLTDRAVNEFKERVKSINQSLHGIYTSLDRNALQDNAVADLFMQFRKWMKPNWNRHFGRVWMKPTFNEQLGAFESPIWKPVYDLSQQGYRMFKENNDFAKLNLLENPKDFLKGLQSMLGYFVKSMAHIRFYYHALPKQEQASMIKWVRSMTTISIIAAGAYMLGKLHDDDDEDTFAYNVAMFTMSALYKEVIEPLPIYGWGSAINQMRDSSFAGERILTSASKVIWYTASEIFNNNPSNYYDRGVYKGQHKAVVALEKMVPVLTQWRKFQNLGSTMNFYNYYNPFN